jgi:photosystem II stability/assembly factor-like uncharacterized protein
MVSRTNDGWDPRLQIDLALPGTLVLALGLPNPWTVLRNTTRLEQNNWYNMTLTIDGPNAQVYINGVFEGKTQGSSPMEDRPFWVLGRSGDNGRAADVCIAHFAVWDKVISASEIEKYYNASKTDSLVPIGTSGGPKGIPNVSIIQVGGHDCIMMSQLVGIDINGNNVTRGRPTSGESNYGDVPSKAVDGNERVRDHPDIYHSREGAYDKWEVRLDKPTEMAKVIYYDRVGGAYRKKENSINFLDSNRKVLWTSGKLNPEPVQEISTLVSGGTRKAGTEFFKADLPNGTYIGTDVSRSGQYIVASGNQGTFLSQDNGKSWKKIRDNSDTAWCRVLDNKMIVVCNDNGRGVWLSRDLGNSWNQVYNATYPRAPGLSKDGSRWFGPIADHGSGVWQKSTDSGNSFNQVHGNPQGAINCIDCSDDGKIVYVCCYGGFLFRSDDYGGSFRRVYNNTMHWQRIYCSGDGETIVAIQAEGGLFLSTNGGNSWTNIQPPGYAVSQGCAISKDSKTISASLQNNKGTMISNDLGKTWQMITSSRGDALTMGMSGDGLTVSAACTNQGVFILAPTDGNEVVEKMVSGCEGENARIVCSSGKKIKGLNYKYGKWEGNGKCGNSHADSSRTMNKYVEPGECVGKESCDMSLGNNWGDPWGGVRKQYEVTPDCK